MRRLRSSLERIQSGHPRVVSLLRNLLQEGSGPL